MSISSKSLALHAKTVLYRLQHCMIHHPIVSNSLLCLGLWSVGDITAQYSEQKRLLVPFDDSSHNATHEELTTPATMRHRLVWERIDWTRTVKCATYGGAVDGPFLAFWYPYLEGLCVRYSIVARYGIWGPPVFKVFVDQFLVEPPCLIFFFGFMNATEGGSLRTFQQKLETQFLPSWLTSLAVWPGILLGTFRWLPTYAQAPFINVCLVAWNGFLSHRNTLSKQEHQNGMELQGWRIHQAASKRRLEEQLEQL